MDNSLLKRLLTTEDCAAIRATWKTDPDFRCTECARPAYTQPYSPHLWSCLGCGFKTYNPSSFFKKKGEAA